MMKRCLAALLFFALPIAAALTHAQTSTASRPASSASASGLDLQFMDRGVDPCTDFYEFACGGWTKNQPIPADRSAWGRAQELQERNNTTLRRILEDAGRNARRRGHPEDRRLLRELHGRERDQRQGRRAARAGAEQDRGADRAARSARAPCRAPLDGRQRLLQFRRRSRFQGSQHGARDRGSGRTRPAGSRLLLPRRREVGRAAQAVRRSRRQDDRAGATGRRCRRRGEHRDARRNPAGKGCSRRGRSPRSVGACTTR